MATVSTDCTVLRVANARRVYCRHDGLRLKSGAGGRGEICRDLWKSKKATGELLQRSS